MAPQISCFLKRAHDPLQLVIMNSPIKLLYISNFLGCIKKPRPLCKAQFSDHCHLPTKNLQRIHKSLYYDQIRNVHWTDGVSEKFSSVTRLFVDHCRLTFLVLPGLKNTMVKGKQ